MGLLSPVLGEFRVAGVKSGRGRIALYVLTILAFAVVGEALLAWAYVGKRAWTGVPFPDLLERYYVVRPFRWFFPEQYNLPEGWQDRFAGDTGSPATVRRFWIADPLLGHRLQRDMIVTETGWTYRATNAQGFIITETANPTYARSKPADVFRIVMLGGSTVEGDGATGSLTALPAVLLDTLRNAYLPARDGQTRIELINAGIGGYYSAQELLYYLSELRGYGADLVLAYNGWNDQNVGGRILQQWGENTPRLFVEERPLQADTLNGVFSTGFLGRILLTRGAASLVELLRGFAVFDMPARLVLKSVAWGGPAGERQPISQHMPEAAARYADNMQILTSVAHRDGSAVAWMLQPLLGVGGKPYGPREEDWRRQANAGDLLAERNAFYTAARRGMADLDSSIGDPSRLCARDLTDVFDDVPEVVYEDGGHLFDNGNVIVARRIARELAACGFVQPR